MIHSSCHAVDDPSAETVIEAPIEVKQDSATRGGLLRIANLRATQGMVVDSNNFERVDLCKVHVSQEPGRDDCLVINDCTGKQVLLETARSMAAVTGSGIMGGPRNCTSRTRPFGSHKVEESLPTTTL